MRFFKSILNFRPNFSFANQFKINPKYLFKINFNDLFNINRNDLVKIRRRDLSIIVANALDYFDTALYAFLAPILAPIFFPEYEPVVQLILTYSTLASSAFTRPVGAFVFGLIARTYGPTTGLSFSLVGMAISSVILGFLPGFADMGWIAPLFLIISRMLRGFFAAGEGTIAKLYVLEGKSRIHALTASHFYQSSAILGMLLASVAATFAISFPENDLFWRTCFCLGGVAGILGYFLRRKTVDEKELTSAMSARHAVQNTEENSLKNTIKMIWQQRANVLKVALGTTFSYITYVVPFVFMNSFVPYITSISLKTMMALNSTLLIFDMIMIPIVGRLLQNLEPRRVMIFAGVILATTIIPLFHGLPDSSILYVTLLRIWIVFWGIVFLCPMNYWFKSLFESKDQYLLVGIGTALGAGTLGRATPAICLFLWHSTGNVLLPAMYLATIILVVALSMGAVNSVEPYKQLISLLVSVCDRVTRPVVRNFSKFLT